MITNKENLHAMQEETRQSINNAKKKISKFRSRNY